MNQKIETPRTRNREWGFYGTCVSAGHADPEAAWDEAMAVLTDQNGPYAFTPEDARDLLDATWGRHLADQLIGEDIRRAMVDLAMNHGWAHDARNFVRQHINTSLPKIAPRTREARKRDRLDFHDLPVWTIREALEKAYEAGRQSAKR